MAIASGDVDEVLGNGVEVLSEPTRDDWEAKYKAGVEVLRGTFYVKEETVGQHIYQLVNWQGSNCLF